MKRNSWYIPIPETWLTWCTYDWQEADNSTRITFNFYCNSLLPKVNRKWNDRAKRLGNNMIEVCTPSDEVYVIKQIAESFGQWVEDADKKITGGTKSAVHVHEENRGGVRAITTNEDIKELNEMTTKIVNRRKGNYAKQWCEKVREARYDINRLLHKFLHNTSNITGNDINACALKRESKSKTTEELLIILPDDDCI
jgi:hypothetical protein